MRNAETNVLKSKLTKNWPWHDFMASDEEVAKFKSDNPNWVNDGNGNWWPDPETRLTFLQDFFNLRDLGE